VKGLLFYVLLGGAFFAAPYANLLFFLIAFLTILGFLGLLWTWLHLRGARGEVEAIEPVPAGSRAEVRARILGGEALRVEIDLEGFGRVGGDGFLPALPRGVHAVRGARVTSTWPFGLFRASRPIPAPPEVVVYPAPAGLAASRGGPGDLAELLGTPHVARDALQPSGVREYRPGDQLSHVHWKASARRGTPVVKEWEGTRGGGQEIVLDLRSPPKPLERALSLVSALALAAREAKETLTLHAQGLSDTFGQDRRPWRELFRFLAAAKALPAGAPAPPPAPPGAARLPLREAVP
jgi:uncharacterized protein (DUF58 family)